MSIFVQKTNRDFLNPIVIRANVRMPNTTTPTMKVGDPLPDINLYPIVNNMTATKQVLVDWKKNCGSDQQCRSNLHLQCAPALGRNSDGQFEVQLDQQKELFVNVVVENKGEDAHQANLTMKLPPNIIYIGVEVCLVIRVDF